MKLKYDVLHIFSSFLPYVESIFNWKLLTLQTNGGGKFKSLISICNKFGIIHHVSCPHIHQQNGLIERKHWHIFETGLALLAHASLPFMYWAELLKMRPN